MTGAIHTTPADMAPFFQRHDRRTRRTYIAMLSLSLALSAIIFTRGLLTTGAAPGAVLAGLWTPIIMGPLTIILLWISSAIYGRSRPAAQPDGSFPMNADDARNVERVANAGAVFVTGMCAIMIAAQSAWLGASVGLLQLPATAGEWVLRAILLGTGALSIYFGNVWPRIPTPRAPEQNPAAHIRYNRLGGWLTVMFGLMLGLAAFLPLAALVSVVVTASIFIIGGTAAVWIMFRIALKSRSAP